MKKRIFAFILAAALLALSIPFATFAASNVCKIGSTQYTSFASAVTAANSATEDVTIELLSDISITEVELKNVNGKRITLDGNGKKITTSGGNNALKINSDMTFSDFAVVHNNWGSAFQIYTCSDVRIENVFIDASAKVKRNYTLINTLGTGAKTTLTLDNVRILMSADPATSQKDLTAIRTGNGSGNVDIKIYNSEIDVSASPDTCAIYVKGETTAKILVENTKFKVAECAIKAAGENIELKNCTWESTLDGYHQNDERLIKDGENVTVKSDISHIYGTQSTSPKGGKFAVRFIAAIRKSEKDLYDSLSLKITAAYGKNVYINKTIEAKSVYESLSGISLDGYYLVPFVLDDVDVKSTETYFTVKLYGKNDNGTVFIDAENFTYKNGAHVVDKLNTADHSVDRDDLSARYLLISDIHYTLTELSKYANRVTYRGYHNDERMRAMCNEIKAEYYRRGLDAIFVLGDLSTDDYPHWHANINYVKKVYDNYLKPLGDELGIPVLIIAGNHDSYPNDMWKAIAGTDRQFVWENPNNGDVFILLDSYDTKNGNTASGASGSSWTGIDETWLEAQLEKYKNKENVFLATHYFGREGNSGHATEIAQLNALLAKYPNVKAMFDAHTHKYSTSQRLANGKWIINTGSYSYDCVKNKNGKYDFDNISIGNLWGFHILEVTDDDIVSYRIETEHTYTVNSSSQYSDATLNSIRSYYNPYTKFEEIKH